MFRSDSISNHALHPSPDHLVASSLPIGQSPCLQSIMARSIRLHYNSNYHLTLVKCIRCALGGLTSGRTSSSSFYPHYLLSFFLSSFRKNAGRIQRTATACHSNRADEEPSSVMATATAAATAEQPPPPPQQRQLQHQRRQRGQRPPRRCGLCW